MLQRLREILRRQPTRTELDVVLQALDDDAGDLTTLQRAELFARAGTLCVQGGESRARAQAYLGEAVDHYLEAGELSLASDICRRLIRISPDPVRPHFTMACIAFADPEQGSAERSLAEYVQATRRTRTEHFALPRLRMLGEIAGDASVARAVADALGELGDDDGRSEILAYVYLNSTPDGQWRDGRATARGVIRAARTDPRDLWARTWMSGVVDAGAAAARATSGP